MPKFQRIRGPVAGDEEDVMLDDAEERVDVRVGVLMGERKETFDKETA